MSGVDIAGLVSEWREAMEGVTPGPWAPSTQKGVPGRCYVAQVFADDEGPSLLSVDPTPDEDVASQAAAWIARCSPSGISALLDALLAQAAELAEARGKQREGAAACLTVAELVALIPLRDTLAAAGTCKDFIAYFKRALAERDEALAALKGCQVALAMMIAPDAIKKTTVINAYAIAVAAATKARSVLENSKPELADATNNPPSDPGTEQREAGV